MPRSVTARADLSGTRAPARCADRDDGRDRRGVPEPQSRQRGRRGCHGLAASDAGELDTEAVADVLLPLVGNRDQLLNNALMADLHGKPLAWARPPDPKVEGSVDHLWLAQVARTGKVLVSPMLGKAGDAAHAIVLAYPIVSHRRPAGRRARPVRAPRSARESAGLDPAAGGFGRHAHRREERGRGAQPRGGALRRPFRGAGRHGAQSVRGARLGDPDGR